jgi:hypothetical protein
LEIPGVKPTYTRWERDGHVSELTVEFPPARLDEVARVLKARKKRQYSPEELAQRAEICARARAAKKSRSPIEI